MSLRALREELEREVARSPLATVPANYVLAMLPLDHELLRWVGTADASEITGLSEIALRSSASRWKAMTHPPIRVSRRNIHNPRSNWVFNEKDCIFYGRKHD